MFEHLQAMPADPILGLNQTFQNDSNPDKINLSVGVYQDINGQTPIFSAVKKAEQRLIDKQKTKTYAPQDGAPEFLRHVSKLMLGAELVDQLGDQLTTVMTPGGCGAVHVGGELLVGSGVNRVWVSDPTWGNHYPLLESVGLTLDSYAYYDKTTRGVDFEGMIESLSNIPQGDAVLLHGCCHNPTGADLTAEQWDAVIGVLAERDLVPFIDIAYQGFGSSLDEDAYGVRESIKRLPEVIIASSYSKNFGVYRERTGALLVVTRTAESTAAAKSHILAYARRSYSMSPYHGGGIVGYVLDDPQLTKEWKTELEQVRQRMNSLRTDLAQGLNQAQDKIDFSFVQASRGMFCFLGIPLEAVLALRAEFAIYLLDSTRINVAGLSEDNLPIIIDRVTQILNR